MTHEIIIVEDYGILREELTHFLNLHGYQTSGVNCGLALDDWLMDRGRPPDIAIICWRNCGTPDWSDATIPPFGAGAS